MEFGSPFDCRSGAPARTTGIAEIMPGRSTTASAKGQSPATPPPIRGTTLVRTEPVDQAPTEPSDGADPDNRGRSADAQEGN